MSKLDRNLDVELDEAKATGEDSQSADAVTPAGGAVKKRKADLKKSVDAKADSVTDEGPSKGTNDEGLKEAFGGLFEGEDLSEDFKTKVETIFEAAVHEKVIAEKAELEQKFENDLQEQVDVVVDELVEKVDSYLDYVIESWLAENAVEIESNIKVEVAESLLGGIKTLVSEHNMELDEETIDHVAEVEEKLQESTTKYNELVEEVVAIKEAKQKLELEIAFKQVAEGLTDTQVDKLGILAEGVSFESVDDYKARVVAIKDNYFAEAVVTPEDATELLEEVVEEKTEVQNSAVNPSVAAYAASLSRFAK